MRKIPMNPLILLALITLLLSGCLEREYSERLEPDSNGQSRDTVTMTYWQRYISEPIIQQSCVSCHQAGGVAAESGFILAHNGQDDYLTHNFENTKLYMSISPTRLSEALHNDSHITQISALNEQQLNAIYLFNQMIYLSENALDRPLIQAKQFYLQNISGSVVQLECVLCHSQTIQDTAKHTSPLYFDFSEQSTSHEFNALMAMSYVLLSATKTQLVDKATGKNHSGGQILPRQSVSAQHLSDFISLIPN